MPCGVFANSPFGLRHAKPFFRPSSPPVGTSEGTENAGDQRFVALSGDLRCGISKSSVFLKARLNRRAAEQRAGNSWPTRRVWRVSLVVGSAFHTLREPWWFIPSDREPVSPCGTAFRCLASHRPGLAPAGDLLSCCTTRKKAKKRTPLPRPLRGFPPSGNAVRGLRKLALRAQTCEALFPPVITSSRHVRGDRKCR